MRENTLQKSALRDLGISNRFTKSHGYNLGRRKNLSTAFYEKLLYSSDKNKFSWHIVTVPFKQGANVVVRLLRLLLSYTSPLPPPNAQFFVCVPQFGPTRNNFRDSVAIFRGRWPLSYISIQNPEQLFDFLSKIQIVTVDRLTAKDRRTHDPPQPL